MGAKQLASRLLQMLIVLIGISFLTFLLTYLSPGDPVRNMYTASGIMPSEEVIQATRDEMSYRYQLGLTGLLYHLNFVFPC